MQSIGGDGVICFFCKKTYCFESCKMRFRYLSCFAVILGLTGCGTYVPNIQEFPLDRRPGADLDLVRAIVRSVHCELRNAVAYVIDEDKAVARLNHGVRNAAWFDNWGVQIALTLTIDEKTTLNPTSTWMPNPTAAVFSLAGGVNLSSDGKRVDQLNYYYTVKELYAMHACRPNDNANAPPGSLLIQSDLKLKEWLLSQIFVAGTGETTIPTSLDTPLKENALSHEVVFEVVSTGSINPAWKFSAVTVNQEGSLLAASRDRTHDLLMTFGPADPTAKSLKGAAANSFLASQIAASINAARANR